MTMINTAAPDTEAWEGEPDGLRGAEDLLANNPNLCDRTFSSKHEAFTVGLYLGTPDPGTRENRDDARTGAILKVIDETPWGDIEVALRVIDEALTVAMNASRNGLHYWENNIDDSPWNDEFSVKDPSGLTPEWRIALLARLLRTIAMAYGLRTDYDDQIGMVILDDDAAATPLRQIIAAFNPPTGTPPDPQATPESAHRAAACHKVSAPPSPAANSATRPFA